MNQSEVSQRWQHLNPTQRRREMNLPKACKSTEFYFVAPVELVRTYHAWLATTWARGVYRADELRLENNTTEYPTRKRTSKPVSTAL